MVAGVTISVRPISTEQHLDVLARRGSASFLQTPAWARVKVEWRGEALGLVASAAGDEAFGGAPGTFRELRKLKRHFAYLPEGPVLDWASVRHVPAHVAPL